MSDIKKESDIFISETGLPAELWFPILDDVPPESLLALAQTSREHKALVDAYREQHPVLDWFLKTPRPAGTPQEVAQDYAARLLDAEGFNIKREIDDPRGFAELAAIFKTAFTTEGAKAQIADHLPLDWAILLRQNELARFAAARELPNFEMRKYLERISKQTGQTELFNALDEIWGQRYAIDVPGETMADALLLLERAAHANCRAGVRIALARALAAMRSAYAGRAMPFHLRGDEQSILEHGTEAVMRSLREVAGTTVGGAFDWQPCMATNDLHFSPLYALILSGAPEGTATFLFDLFSEKFELTPLHRFILNGEGVPLQAEPTSMDDKTATSVVSYYLKARELGLNLDWQNILVNLVEVLPPDTQCYGAYLLHIAVKYQCVDAVRILLKRGADFNAEDRNRRTPQDFIRAGDIKMKQCFNVQYADSPVAEETTSYEAVMTVLPGSVEDEPAIPASPNADSIEAIFEGGSENCDVVGVNESLFAPQG